MSVVILMCIYTCVNVQYMCNIYVVEHTHPPTQTHIVKLTLISRTYKSVEQLLPACTSDMPLIALHSSCLFVFLMMMNKINEQCLLFHLAEHHESYYFALMLIIPHNELVIYLHLKLKHCFASSPLSEQTPPT